MTDVRNFTKKIIFKLAVLNAVRSFHERFTTSVKIAKSLMELHSFSKLAQNFQKITVPFSTFQDIV